MRIAFIDDEPEIFPLQYGGKARTILSLAKALRLRGHKTSIYSRSVQSDQKTVFVDGTPITKIDGYGIVRTIRDITSSADIVNVHACSFSTPLVEEQKKMFFHLHDVIFATVDAGSHLDKSLSYPWRAILSPSEYASGVVRNVGGWNRAGANVQTIGRWIDTDIFRRVPRPYALEHFRSHNPEVANAISESNPVVLFPNRVNAGKGESYLPNLVDALNRKYQKPLVLTTTQQPVKGTTSTGWIPSALMPSLYSLVDLCVIPTTLPETFCQTAYEASACGTRVLTFPFGNLGNLPSEIDMIHTVAPDSDKFVQRALELLRCTEIKSDSTIEYIRTECGENATIERLLGAYQTESTVLPRNGDSVYFLNPLCALVDGNAYLAGNPVRSIRISDEEHLVLNSVAHARTKDELTRMLNYDPAITVDKLIKSDLIVEG